MNNSTLNSQLSTLHPPLSPSSPPQNPLSTFHTPHSSQTPLSTFHSPHSPPHNPDVLSCLANLSSDEVFTPPKIVNDMLDLLPQELFSNENSTFLDPVCKSGVFLREIAKRLLKGLETKIPDLQERIDHIFHKQLFGIAITELTSLLSRRSVYCSKYPNSPYSITRFDDAEGNIRFRNIPHTWLGEKCEFCGAAKTEYDREETLEQHAYEFIHGFACEEGGDCEMWKVESGVKKGEIMKFDVIIGNPPYQMSTGGESAQATPLYHKFVQQAKKLMPRYLCMITPSRWFVGGMGLDNFRKEMLEDNRICTLVDYPISNELFPNVEIKGGVCYFLWDREHAGKCNVKMVQAEKVSVVQRNLLLPNSDVYIRFNEAISILEKVLICKEATMDTVVSPIDPFGFPSNFRDFTKEENANLIKIYANKTSGYISREKIAKNIHLVDKHKVLVSEAYGAGEGYPHQILNKPFLAENPSCCTFTYMSLGAFDDIEDAKHLITYVQTKFFRFLVSLKKHTQHASSKVYSFVPLQDFSESWTDAKLYAKYGLTAEEIAFIESMIRPMELGNGGDGED